MKCSIFIILFALAALSLILEATRFRDSISKSLRPLFKNLVTISVATCVIVSNPSISFSNIGEGDLPEGSMAFSKLLKYQSDWKKLSDNLASRDYNIPEPEILNTKLFLKQLANEYYDMELLVKGITDPTKAVKAKEIMKDFRNKIRECDDAASNGNVAKIGENYPVTSSELNEFLGLLQDVPDEL